MYLPPICFSELCAAVQEQDQKQLQKSLPLLQHKLSKTGSAMSDCLHTKDYALAWYVVTDFQIRVRTGKLFFYFSTKTYVVGIQKNASMIETVLLSTQNTCLN